MPLYYSVNKKILGQTKRDELIRPLCFFHINAFMCYMIWDNVETTRPVYLDMFRPALFIALMERLKLKFSSAIMDIAAPTTAPRNIPPPNPTRIGLPPFIIKFFVYSIPKK